MASRVSTGAPQARLGDTSSHGGTIVTGAQRTLVDGKPAARMGDLHVCPIPFHGVTRIVRGAGSTLVEGHPAARMGDIAGCGAVIVRGGDRTAVS